MSRALQLPYLIEPLQISIMKKQLTPKAASDILNILSDRFTKNVHRHPNANWKSILKKLEKTTNKIWSLHEMEQTGGEPDVVDLGLMNNEIIFADCAPESPSGRRSICFDREGWESRKEHRPANNAMDMAAAMGISILNEDEYRALQKLETFDTKTSSWIQTPDAIRILGGALFADFRYGQVFIYHNGAQSYYAGRGFRGLLRL